MVDYNTPKFCPDRFLKLVLVQRHVTFKVRVLREWPVLGLLIIIVIMLMCLSGTLKRFCRGWRTARRDWTVMCPCSVLLMSWWWWWCDCVCQEHWGGSVVVEGQQDETGLWCVPAQCSWYWPCSDIVCITTTSSPQDIQHVVIVISIVITMSTC